MDCTESVFKIIETLLGAGTLTIACWAGYCAHRAWLAQEEQVKTQREQLKILQADQVETNREREALLRQMAEEAEERAAARRARIPVLNLMDTFPEKGVQGLQRTDAIYRRMAVMEKATADYIRANGENAPLKRQLLMGNWLPGTKALVMRVNSPIAPEGVKVGAVRTLLYNPEPGDNFGGEAYCIGITAPAHYFRDRIGTVEFTLSYRSGAGDLINRPIRYRIGENKLEEIQEE